MYNIMIINIKFILVYCYWKFQKLNFKIYNCFINWLIELVYLLALYNWGIRQQSAMVTLSPKQYLPLEDTKICSRAVSIKHK